MSSTLIISTNRCTSPSPVMPIGACLVAEAAEKAGHRAVVLDLMFENNPLQSLAYRLDREKPDVVGISLRNIDNNYVWNPLTYYEDLVPIVRTIRAKSRAPIILGGSAVGVMPEALLRLTDVSWVATGDGETIFPRFLASLSRGLPPTDVPGLAWLEGDTMARSREASVSPMSSPPLPSFHRWINIRAYSSRLAAVPLQTKRGCPHQCIYCTYQALEGRGYRLCPPEAVTEALARVARIGLRDVELVDNVFNSPYEHALSICERLADAKHRLRFQTVEINPLFLDDDLLSSMERAGFCGIGITAESGADDVLARLRKGFTAEAVHKAAAAVRRHTLPCIWIFVFGGPGETKRTVLETLRFVDLHLRPSDAAFFNVGLRIYPGTELERIARAEGRLTIPPEDMLKPVFYISPELDLHWLSKTLHGFMASHLNCLSSDSIAVPFLPTIQRIGCRLGLSPPLWKHTRHIRRIIRIFRPDL